MERFRYDRSSKWLIDHHGDSILRIAGVDDVVSFKAVVAEVVQPRQLPDGLLEVRRRRKRAKDLFLLEIETYVDRETEQQIMDDLMMVYQAKRVVPEVVLLVLRPKGKLETRRESVLSSPSGATQIFARWPAVELWKVPASAMLEMREPGLVPWIPLMNSVESPESVFRACREIIDQKALQSEKANLLAVSQVLGGLRYNDQWLQHFFGGDEAMIDSPVLNRFLRENIAKEFHRSIARVLRARLGPVPADVRTAMEKITDGEVLNTLSVTAATCPDFDSFRGELAKEA